MDLIGSCSQLNRGVKVSLSGYTINRIGNDRYLNHRIMKETFSVHLAAVLRREKGMVSSRAEAGNRNSSPVISLGEDFKLCSAN